MKLTRELLHLKGDGHTRAQLQVLGVEWPPEKGWLSRMIGTEISTERYQEFVKLGQHTRRVQKMKEPATRPTGNYPELFAVEPSRDDHKPLGCLPNVEKKWAPVKPTDGAAERWANDFYEANNRNLE